jgi:hypothetical protein
MEVIDSLYGNLDERMKAILFATEVDTVVVS